MERALVFELEKNIPELVNAVYPTNAPEERSVGDWEDYDQTWQESAIPWDGVRPYLVYARISTQKVKTLSGYTGKQHLSYMFSIMAKRYGDMHDMRGRVEALLISLLQQHIGENQNIYVEDLDINNITETWEPQLKVNRGIIDFTIYF